MLQFRKQRDARGLRNPTVLKGVLYLCFGTAAVLCIGVFLFFSAAVTCPVPPELEGLMFSGC